MAPPKTHSATAWYPAEAPGETGLPARHPASAAVRQPEPTFADQQSLGTTRMTDDQIGNTLREGTPRRMVSYTGDAEDRLMRVAAAGLGQDYAGGTGDPHRPMVSPDVATDATESRR